MTHHIPAALGLARDVNAREHHQIRYTLDTLGGRGTAERLDRVQYLTAELLKVGASVDEALAIAGPLSGQVSWETIANTYFRFLGEGRITAADVVDIAQRLEPHP